MPIQIYRDQKITKPRSERRKFQDFAQYFKIAVEQISGKRFEPNDERGLCLCYDNLRMGQKSKLLKDIARQMNIKPKQAQKHYVNCFARAKYPVSLSETVKAIIVQRMLVFIQNERSGQPLKDVVRYLADNGIERFQPSVQAYAHRMLRVMDRNKELRPPLWDAAFLDAQLAAARAETPDTISDTQGALSSSSTGTDIQQLSQELQALFHLYEISGNNAGSDNLDSHEKTDKCNNLTQSVKGEKSKVKKKLT